MQTSYHQVFDDLDAAREKPGNQAEPLFRVVPFLGGEGGGGEGEGRRKSPGNEN